MLLENQKPGIKLEGKQSENLERKVSEKQKKTRKEMRASFYVTGKKKKKREERQKFMPYSINHLFEDNNLSGRT